ncbi:MAG: hypothetical protein ACE5G0_02860 [Rhodothermales bacterium]
MEKIRLEVPFTLERLHVWLKYEISTAFLFVIVFFAPYNLVLIVLVGIAVLFTPFMLITLYRAQRTSWVVAFLVLVGVPTVLGFVGSEDRLLNYFFRTLPLILFFTYCWCLRHAVGEWLEEKRWKAQWEEPVVESPSVLNV